MENAGRLARAAPARPGTAEEEAAAAMSISVAGSRCAGAASTERPARSYFAAGGRGVGRIAGAGREAEMRPRGLLWGLG